MTLSSDFVLPSVTLSPSHSPAQQLAKWTAIWALGLAGLCLLIGLVLERLDPDEYGPPALASLTIFAGVGVIVAVMHASRASFGRYLYARLGPGSPGQCLGHMLSRALGASDFSRFWQYWNPFWGYFLAYYCFAPLRRFAPRSLCLVVTFAVNGIVHDLVFVWPWGVARTACLPFPFPLFTLSLAINAVIMSAAGRYRFTLARLSLPKRVACHLLALVGPFAFSVALLLLLRVCGG
jgi:hypothetical protein